MSASFDDPSLVVPAGLVPAVALAGSVGIGVLVRERLTVPGPAGANAGVKVMCLVAEMLAGADSIDDMGLLRHGATGKLFKEIRAPSTLGTFLRAFTFGHVPSPRPPPRRQPPGSSITAPPLQRRGQRLAKHRHSQPSPATTGHASGGAAGPRRFAHTAWPSCVSGAPP